ncbi:MAG: hypothetical protein H6509_11845 [Bryobacterales bacterium]|nr:hypothetical protein [Acidobacteriota bacterium]MCB9385300.1 hypothetical protein [Bryobacterales bacterium]
MFQIRHKAARAVLWSALAITPMIGFSGCDNDDGPAEKMGEAIDDAAGDVKDAAKDVGDGIKDAANDVKDAVDKD